MTTFVFQETDIPDVAPDDFSNDGIDLCKSCHQKPVKPYGGRGPRPTKCADCSTTSVSRGAPRVKGGNAALAAQAVTALTQLHNFGTLGLMVMQMHQTANKWSDEVTDEKFKASLYEALLLDPELCRWICRGGVKSGKVAMFIAYLIVGASVGPTAVAELKDKKAERVRLKAEEDAQQDADDTQTINATPIWTP